jgi:hypothetical protein
MECDVGREFGSPVSPDYGPRRNEFRLAGITITSDPGYHPQTLAA